MGPPVMMAEGMSVLLDINGEKVTFMTIRKNQHMECSSAGRLRPGFDGKRRVCRRVKVGKGFYSLGPLIGEPFGSVFEMQSFPGEGSRLVRVQSHSAEELAEAEGMRQREPEEEGGVKDNRALLDDNRAQGLSATEIEDMKHGGATGSAIIAALCANSASFHSKTEFSQEKYLRKKQKKYAPRLTVRRPSAATICSAYFSKAPARTGHLRVDTLALMLSLGNVGAHARVLMVDQCGGLPSAAVAERLGGFGSVCAATFPPRPTSIDIVRSFNFDPATAACITRASLRQMVEARRAARDPPQEAEVEKEVEVVEEKEVEEEVGKEVGVEVVQERKMGSKMGRPAEEWQVKAWAQHGFTSCVIAAPSLSPLACAQCVLPLLAPSSPFVIYHPHLQPLTECMVGLQKEKAALGVQLTEPWLREYQVLPQRSHPMMQMSGSGGYLLHGITLAPGDANMLHGV